MSDPYYPGEPEASVLFYTEVVDMSRDWGNMSSHQVPEKILVVDDEQMIRELLKRVLGREGYQVTTAPCGEEVVRLMSTTGFDLALVDAGGPSRARGGSRLIRQAAGRPGHQPRGRRRRRSLVEGRSRLGVEELAIVRPTASGPPPRSDRR